MITKPVTTVLKEVLDECAISTIHHIVYSDTRKASKNRKTVGIKFVFLYLSNKRKEMVIQKMKKRGYIFYYINENIASNYYNGTRFCFSKYPELKTHSNYNGYMSYMEWLDSYEIRF